MPVPSLNVDILYYIMAHSTRKTLLKMMRTSRDMHRGGIKYLLRNVPSIWTEKKFRSFLSFCDARGEVAEVAYRMTYLRGLEMNLDLDDFDCDDLDGFDGFDCEDEDEIQRRLGPTSQALTHFLTSTVRVYAYNFTRLLLLSCDSLLAADPNLSRAIASLTTLTYLNFGDATERCFELLGSLQSRLAEANIGMNIDLIDPPDGDLTAFLRHSESSMTVLSLNHTSHPTGVACYPQLHTLDIRYLNVPTTRHYVTTFPNLQVLHASECISAFSEDEEEWMRRRSFNITQQAEDGSWRTLRAYVGSILLYLFGLGCHVTYIHVYAEQEYDAMDFRHVRAVAADTCPEHLVVDVSDVSFAVDQAEEIIALFKSTGFRGVRTFVLDMHLRSNDHITDMQAMLVSIFRLWRCRRALGSTVPFPRH